MTILSGTSMPELTPSRPRPGEPVRGRDEGAGHYGGGRDSAYRPVPVPVPVKHTVGDVMIKGVVAAHEEAAFKQVVDALVRNHIGAVPVIDSGRRVVGVVSESDLLVRMSGGHLVLPSGHLVSAHAEEHRKLHATTARELMTSPPIVARSDMPIVEAAQLAAQNRVRRLPVVDDDGVLVGLVSRTDLLKVFLRPDGEIRDDIRHNVLVGAVAFNPHLVDVEVDYGVVTVRGEVADRATVSSLVHAIEAVSGVIAVDTAALSVAGSGGPPRTWPRTRS